MKEINAIKIGGCTLLAASKENFPITSGNCFDLIGEDWQSYRILNFVYENLKYLLEYSNLSFPIKLLVLSEKRHAVINDSRIPDNWYNNTFCEVCTPPDLLPLPQRLVLERANMRRKISSEIVLPADYGLLKFKSTKKRIDESLGIKI